MDGLKKSPGRTSPLHVTLTTELDEVEFSKNVQVLFAVFAVQESFTGFDTIHNRLCTHPWCYLQRRTGEDWFPGVQNDQEVWDLELLTVDLALDGKAWSSFAGNFYWSDSSGLFWLV